MTERLVEERAIGHPVAVVVARRWIIDSAEESRRWCGARGGATATRLHTKAKHGRTMASVIQ
jgi:hypothetical protein